MVWNYTNSWSNINMLKFLKPWTKTAACSVCKNLCYIRINVDKCCVNNVDVPVLHCCFSLWRECFNQRRDKVHLTHVVDGGGRGIVVRKESGLSRMVRYWWNTVWTVSLLPKGFSALKQQCEKIDIKETPKIADNVCRGYYPKDRRVG